MSGYPAAGSLPARRAISWPLFAAGGGFALLLIVIVGGLAGGRVGSPSYGTSALALADIPSDYLVAYERAARRFGLDWAILAAIGKLECDHGRSDAAGCDPPGSVNPAGATGPMQFLGSTWRTGTPAIAVPDVGPPTRDTRFGYATDGDGDGLADVWDAADAIAGAARLLAANGAPDDYQSAIYAYNHAGWYVDAVLAKANEYRAIFGVDPSDATLAAVSWAVAHVGRFSYRLGAPTDRGGDVTDMQGRNPAGSTCDCSMYVRWSWAQAGIDVGLTTVQQWTGNGLLPDGDSAAEYRLPRGNPPQPPPPDVPSLVMRGVGGAPPGGYRPGDIIFFGHGEGADGHDALWLGNGLIVQCSSSGGGSNIRALAGYVTPTGWIRWDLRALQWASQAG